jgi:hypothetical protein
MIDKANACLSQLRSPYIRTVSIAEWGISPGDMVGLGKTLILGLENLNYINPVDTRGYFGQLERRIDIVYTPCLGFGLLITITT